MTPTKPIDVYISVKYDCNEQGGFFVFSGYSDSSSSAKFGGSPINVDTSVTVTIQYSDLVPNTYQVVIDIFNGTSNGVGSFSTELTNQITDITILSIVPSSSANQIYINGGTQNVGTC
jgi:hypothetical protein